eukprot:15441275-Alexandrium_andersonii.AAC.1
MDLSELLMSAPSQLFRATRETCPQFGARRMLVLFGLPYSLHPAYSSAFNAAVPDLRVTTNKSEAEVLVCGEPSCSSWREQRIASVLGVWGVKE